MEEAGCNHALQLHAEPRVSAPATRGLGFNHRVTQNEFSLVQT